MRQRFSLRKATSESQEQEATHPCKKQTASVPRGVLTDRRSAIGRFAKGLLRLFFSGLGRRILARWRLLALLHLLLLLGVLFLQLLGLLLMLLL